MTRTIRHALLALPLLALASGCGGPSKWFFAEIKEPGICKQLTDITMSGTQPGAELTLTFIVTLGAIPLFDSNAGEVEILPLNVTFNAKSGIQDFNSVDSAWILAKPDPANTAGLTDTEIVRYDRAPGFSPGTELTIAAHQDVNLVPFLSGSGQDLTVESHMNGGLPQNPWVTDINACLATNARVDYLAAFGIHL
ncbi:MAG TPA: hypothetical protein VFA20_21975 [Myxococcaceae bacterium]|nr:hypothetical protein [Myxococcaceae bacterium]